MKIKNMFLIALMLSAISSPVFAYTFNATTPSGHTIYCQTIGTKVKIIPSNSIFGDLIIPDSVVYGGFTYPVTEIGTSAFNSNSNMTSVLIPNTVTIIGDMAFYACNGLSSVTMSNSVVEIGEEAFRGCTGLSILSLGNSLTNIKRYAFYQCQNIGTIVLPNTLITIGEGAFSGCSNLHSITIPNSVTTIGNNAFADCTNMFSVTIGESVLSIGNGAFNNCSNIVSVVIPNSVQNLGSAFNNCSNLESVVIGNSVTSVGGFNNCTALESVTMGNSVTCIGGFTGCSSLMSVTIPNTVTTISGHAFDNCDGLTSIVIPNSVTDIQDYAFYGCDNLQSVILGTGLIYIRAGAFNNCPQLTSVYSYATTPPNSSTGNFSLCSGGHIYVPCGTINSYSSTSAWGDRSYPNPSWYSYAWFPYDLSIEADNTQGTVTIVPIIEDACGTSIESLTAVAKYGYHFTQWSDGDTNNPRIVSLTTDTSFSPLFARNPYIVTALSANSEMGYVEDFLASHEFGDTVTLTATPATGYHFSHWSDGDSNATRTITVSQDTTLTAYFEINSYTLTVLPNGSTLGTVTGSGIYTHGSSVTVTATPAAGNHFDHWSDNSLLANYTFTLTSDLQLVAVFVPIDTVYFYDTTYIDVHDTTYIDVPVHDTTYIDIHDTTYINVYDTIYIDVHDTTFVDVPYAVHDTTYIDVHDTTYIDVPYPVHDTTYIDVPYPVHDTTYIDVHDTTYIEVPVHDTTYINVHDTTYVDVYVHDTTIIQDTTYIDVPYPVHDTTYVTLTDTVTNTEYVYDTVTNTEYIYDTVTNTVYDTTLVTDTIWLTRTDTIYLPLYIYDTVYIHDTVYVGVDDVEVSTVKLYQRDGRIVVEGGEGQRVMVFDAVGRVVAESHPAFTGASSLRGDGWRVTFEVPASGVYLVKIGDFPARRVVVIR